MILLFLFSNLKFLSKRSLILVIIQFTCLAYFLFFERFLTGGFLLIVQFTGFVVALWGVWAMKIGNFNIQPEIKPSAVFVNKGPYKLIRNPMYFGLITFFGSILFYNFTWKNFVIYLILCTVLYLKIEMEEKFLTEKFGSNYTVYLANTYRIIPFVY